MCLRAGSSDRWPWILGRQTTRGLDKRVSSEVLLAGTWKDDLGRSSDGGRNSVRLPDFLSLNFHDRQTGDGVIYAATDRDCVFASADGGETWKRWAPERTFYGR